jgi:hypothetical protein
LVANFENRSPFDRPIDQIRFEYYMSIPAGMPPPTTATATATGTATATATAT